MRVWIVIRCGVYRHEIGGAFSSLDLATAAANELLSGEPDARHSYEVLEVALDVAATHDGPYKRGDFGALNEGKVVAEIAKEK